MPNEDVCKVEYKVNSQGVVDWELKGNCGKQDDLFLTLLDLQQPFPHVLWGKQFTLEVTSKNAETIQNLVSTAIAMSRKEREIIKKYGDPALDGDPRSMITEYAEFDAFVAALVGFGFLPEAASQWAIAGYSGWPEKLLRDIATGELAVLRAMWNGYESKESELEM